MNKEQYIYIVFHYDKSYQDTTVEYISLHYGLAEAYQRKNQGSTLARVPLDKELNRTLDDYEYG